MATTEEVQKLAALARISVADAELEKFTSEFDAILAYVGQLEKLNLPTDGAGAGKPPLRNVMRADGTPHESGAYTKRVVAQFPAHEGDALAVKQIITHE
ncbi:MAG TPA: Asp-tRNA(Asn)/Glu-tRNA(Gln) amidotransferase subunit GatC [Candidatus Paceibacterota bacterium]|nr:Asp-tRNA(Asn)/Glu-tRNA(Gln) amidotransferase subunit GatC [Candidatus Paceibacterota bacterium]